MMKSNIMKRAWEIFRTLVGDYKAKLSTALKRAWAEVKSNYTAVVSYLESKGYTSTVVNENEKQIAITFSNPEIRVHYSVYKNNFAYGFKTKDYDAKTKTIAITNIEDFTIVFTKTAVCKNVAEYISKFAERHDNRVLKYLIA